MEETENISWLQIIKIILISLAIVIPIRIFLFQPFLVDGSSMKPTLVNHDYLIVDEISYRFHKPQRGDIVVFRYPRNPSQLFVKRIVGLPGETIKISGGNVYLKKGNQFVLFPESFLPTGDRDTQGDEEITLNKDQYFVLGDNRHYFASYDSRNWGPLPRKNIIGKVFLRVWHFPLKTL